MATQTTEGNNSRFTLPPDIGEATVYVKNRLEKLLSDRAWIAANQRTIIQDAKKHGFATGITRKTISLDTMTPEKREKWRKEIEAAAAHFGLSGLAIDDEIKPDTKMVGFIEKSRHLTREKKEVGKALKELKEVAIENGVDYEMVKLIVTKPLKLAKDVEDADADAAEDWMHRLDKIASFLGIW